MDLLVIFVVLALVVLLVSGPLRSRHADEAAESAEHAELAAARVEYAWGGHVAFTRDQLPHAGALDGVYFAGGYCGHGIAMATFLGEQIARRMAGEPMANPLFDD